MYENLYSYNEKINEKSVWIVFQPNFREAITLYNGNNKIFSDGEVRMEGELILDGECSKYPKVYISEDAQWGLEDPGYEYMLFVTERTEKITTPLGPEWNEEFNRLLKKCKSEYYQKKKEEIRLYFYDATHDKLHLCDSDESYWEHDNYRYSLNRYFVPYCAIDKRYAKPEKDCFILGRIRKTIGLKNSKLLDFIEPVHEILLDFEKDKNDFGDYEYKENKRYLEKNLLELLKFSISKEHNSLEIMRIRAYLQNYSDEAISKFDKEIQSSFKEGNVSKVRQLYYVLNTPQDCTDVQFELRLKEEVECSPDKNFYVFFVNGEMGYVSAKWVYQNIRNCTDANGVYLGTLKDRYNFY